MIADVPLIFLSPVGLWVALLLTLVGAAVALMRGTGPRGTGGVLIGLGAVAIALAAGQPAWQPRGADDVVVMVDVSASTRGALYRDGAELRRRIAELLGRRPYRLVLFAGHNHPATIDTPIMEMTSERTVFDPPAGAGAIVLFSDGRFELPAIAPPTYAVLDPGLEHVNDARVEKLEIRGNNVVATIASAAPDRELLISGAADSAGVNFEAPGERTISRSLAAGAVSVEAKWSPADAWPENDALRIDVPPPESGERWWVGSTPRSIGWKKRTVTQLPNDAAAYLSADLIVLDDVAAADLSARQIALLQEYVRDAGGAMVIDGARRAFGPGGYAGTGLDELSPLASVPASTGTQWMLLVDSSGSMDQQATANRTKWTLATAAVREAIAAVPADDLVSVGAFAQAARWWVTARPAKEVRNEAIVPTEEMPRGPTNLQPVLEEMAADRTGAERRLLVVTDGEVKLENVAALAGKLMASRIRLSVLAIAGGAGLADLRQLCVSSGGELAEVFEPDKWAAAARQLISNAAMPKELAELAAVVFSDDAATLPPRQVSPWLRTWAKPAAQVLATADVNGTSVPLVARWQFGAGRVLAAAFDLSADEMQTLSDSVRQAPADPRLHVTWDVGRKVTAKVDAVADGQYLNGLDLQMRWSAGIDVKMLPLRQSGPGQYVAQLDAPREPGLAVVLHEGHVVARQAVAGRYPAEFDAVGNDRAALRELASRSGGAVILPDQHQPIDFPHQGQPLLLTAWFATAGAAFLIAGLLWHRRALAQ